MNHVRKYVLCVRDHVGILTTFQTCFNEASLLILGMVFKTLHFGGSKVMLQNSCVLSFE